MEVLRKWEQWKKGGAKEEYLKTKKSAKTVVYFENGEAQTEQFVSINSNSDINYIFKMVKSLKRGNVDAVGEKWVRNDNEKQAWQSHHQKLLNVEFLWNAANMSEWVKPQKPQRWHLKQSESWNLAKLLDSLVLS